ncbi:MAG: cysteine--tRNA ligase [Anaerolineae bacterium]|nr:cysteine--tRNA ligase [Anaerolineae bacterium]
MALEIYNTLTRRKEKFEPLHPGFVGIYVCGPTVYDHPHIGHAKSYVSFDVVVRYLRYLGYKVRYVQNITDVGHLLESGEDRVLKRAKIERLEPMEVVEKYTRSYFEDMDALNIQRPDISPRASGHIPEQIELVKVLIEKGYAYEVSGSVYFEVAKFPDYGKLSGQKVEELLEGYRIDPSPDKKHPADFALWKRAEPEHIMRWPSPWGWGYPGWHIECSVMSTKYLGQPFDIHGGGMDNIFPHHECEIAQSEAAHGVPFVRYWMHNNMVTVKGVKMSKSLGNAIYLKDLFKRYNPMTVRFFILSSHYRSTLDFSDEALSAAEKGLERLWNTVREVRERIPFSETGPIPQEVTDVLANRKARFLAAMDDDFNTATAIGELFELSREVNIWLTGDRPLSKDTLMAIDSLYTELGDTILGIIPQKFPEQVVGELEVPLIQLLIELRQEFRTAREWEKADRIRSRLMELGIILEDTPQGTRWRRVRVQR